MLHLEVYPFLQVLQFAAVWVVVSPDKYYLAMKKDYTRMSVTKYCIFSIIKHKISAIFLFVAVILRIFAARNSIIRMIKDEEL